MSTMSTPSTAERRTRSQQAVLAVLENERGRQLTAQDLHRRAQTIHPPIGLATVYRTLATLEEEGVVDVVTQDGRESAYRLCSPGHHHHLVCNGCGTVVEIEECDLGALERRLARRYKFRIVEHAITVRGLCQRCAR
ncbi:MAG TPA: Fur family transcriptional regulator [Actinomycetota bacterium]|nr:Fur family transcriptional regulator [Actinomycetota bacterium]